MRTDNSHNLMAHRAGWLEDCAECRIERIIAKTNAGNDCRYGKCECPRCRCGAALDSPQCEDYHRRHPHSKRGAR